MITHVAVVVPAADEEELIGDCLAALELAVRHLRLSMVTPPTVDVTVVLDACRDGTADVVAAFPGIRAVRSELRSVGASRAFGTADALAARGSLGNVWTAHTDADSAVPPNWLTHMVSAADKGFDLVLGTVTPSGGLPRRVRRAWYEEHSPHEGHSHVHGANLGIRATTFHAVGGWPPVRTGEDVELAARAVAAGARVERTGRIPVRTSARSAGRAPFGFSSYLRTLAAVVAGGS